MKYDSLGRKIPIRTAEWKRNISLAVNKKTKLVCECGKEFYVSPYRKDTARFCSGKCQRELRKFPKTGKSIINSLAKTGIKNPMWNKTKEDAGISAIHSYVRRRLRKRERCQHCKKVKKLDLANKSRKYKRDLGDWLWLCRRCHLIYDDNLKYLKLGRKKKQHDK